MAVGRDHADEALGRLEVDAVQVVAGLVGRDREGGEADHREEILGRDRLELDLVELVNAFRRVLEKAPQESFHEVGSENISIADRISDILEFLQGKELVVFDDLFQGSLTREYLVATFLAILELCRLKLIKLTQVESFGQIWIKSAVVSQDDEQFVEETVDRYRT